MKDIKVSNSLNMSNRQLKSAALENISGLATTLVSGKIWINTSNNRIYYVESDGSTIVQLARRDDMNTYGSLIGTLDASGGFPDGTTAGQIGSGVDEDGSTLTGTASIQAGDFWIISTGATIVGIQGEDVLEVGDFLMATVDGASTAGDFIGMKTNIDSSSLQNLYNADSSLTANRTVNGGSNNLSFINIGDYTINASSLSLSDSGGGVTINSSGGSIDLHDLTDGGRLVISDSITITSPVDMITVVSGNCTETLSNGKTSTASSGNLEFVSNAGDISMDASGGDVLLSTNGAGNHIRLSTNNDGSLVINKTTNPETNITVPEDGMITYDLTNNRFIFRQNGSWVYLGGGGGSGLINATITSAALVANVPYSLSSTITTAGITNIISLFVYRVSDGLRLHMKEDINLEEITSGINESAVNIEIIGV